MRVKLVHKNSPNLIKFASPDGFSWGALLLGVFWYWIHGLWGKGFMYLLIELLVSWTIVGIPIMWVVMGNKFNREYYENLLERGYLEKEER